MNQVEKHWQTAAKKGKGYHGNTFPKAWAGELSPETTLAASDVMATLSNCSPMSLCLVTTAHL